ncbi:OLC1v1022075C1 [Oldenlandia corymbosa var. corymbosa]|uniref:OLC1v1022075C1 n=1 Tax=Oldenlandia corymbosa var. corymbosa TaxID=529605 RepID=A0AAV1BX19_OLDCO|nr:OLC1v1022075C1 [Oldenlandia corymbosa var. corymbosa]
MEYSPKFFFAFLLLLIPSFASSLQQNQVYIVYFGEHSGEKTAQEIEEHHHSYLYSVKDTEEDARSSLIYSYKHSINGFAAKLSPEEAQKLSENDEVVSVLPSKQYSVHTTRSWEFVGIERSPGLEGKVDKDELIVKARYGKDVIAGVLDSGVWPESESFSDEGMGPIPKRWKGACATGDNFKCNKKIIGARFYIKGYESYYGPLNRTLDSYSPRDVDGHGSHTASTVAGRRVPNVASAGGFARGTASGGAPHARLAIYKVCWAIPGQEKSDGNTCFAEDMLAGIDDAINDGIDVLSASIGAHEPYEYYYDFIAIGALHAIKKNIVVSCSAGNDGPKASTLSNPAPWILTVGASSMDRTFVADIHLGNGKKVKGQTITAYKLENKMYPLVRAAQVAHSNVAKNMTDQCLPGSLDPKKARGKIVMCLRGAGLRVGKGQEAKRAGAVGFILGNSKANGEELSVDAHVLPANAVGYKNAMRILKYIDSTKNPKAYIGLAKTVYKDVTAPFMAAFSSRGPSVISPDILKPDITAPGLNVLAAWSGGASPTKLSTDHRRVKYNVLSGTSMSCPHVSGAAVLLKAIHPDWSSAAIRSAIMTTAALTNNKGHPITDASGNEADPFQFGAGHFRPTKAADPGLIYDASYEDYALYVCNFNNSKKVVPHFHCPKKPPSPGNLNYPSVAVPKLKGTVVIKRTVTNVGSSTSNSIYFATAKPPVGISVKISPPILIFKHLGEKKSFTITFRAEPELEVGKIPKGEYLFGHYSWNDANNVYDVRSPIAVALA